MKRDRTWAWLVPWAGGGVVGRLENPLTNWAGDGRSLAILLALLAALLLVTGGAVEVTRDPISPNDMIGFGVLAGLVLTETRRSGGEWAHQRRTSLTSRQTMSDLR
jgi:hypothetical protein